MFAVAPRCAQGVCPTVTGGGVWQASLDTGAATPVSSNITYAPAGSFFAFAQGSIVCGNNHVAFYTADDTLQQGNNFDVFVVTDLTSGATTVRPYESSAHHIFAYDFAMACESPNVLVLGDSYAAVRYNLADGTLAPTAWAQPSPPGAEYLNADGSEMWGFQWAATGDDQGKMTSCSSSGQVLSSTSGQQVAAPLLPCATAAGAAPWAVAWAHPLGGAGSRTFTAVLGTPVSTVHPGRTPPVVLWSLDSPWTLATVSVDQSPPIVKARFNIDAGIYASAQSVLECDGHLVLSNLPQVTVIDMASGAITRQFSVPFDAAANFASAPVCRP